MIPRIARIALWSLLGAALTACAYLLISTTFMPYDDEGYVLISIRNYLAGLRLYDDIFSQYGPWPFVYHQLVTAITGWELTHTLGRMLTLGHWVMSALLCGMIGWRLTRSQLAAGAAAVIAFALCWQNTSEPSHPGSHIALLVALAAVITSGLPDSRRPVVTCTLLGAIIALLLLTKINVGLLLAAGVACFGLRHTPWPERWQRGAHLLAALGLLALPWVLMGRQLGLGWVFCFALLFCLSALGLLWISPATTEAGNRTARAWLATPIACAVVVGLVFGIVVLHGTRVSSLLEGIVVSPLRMPAHFMVGLHWYPEVWLLTVISGAVVFMAGRDLRAHGQVRPFVIRLIVLLRGAALLALAGLARYWPTHAGIFHFSAYCLPLLPLFLIPLGQPADRTQSAARWAAACVALPQILHAFPVAGSQLAWGTFLCVPIMVAGIYEAGVALPVVIAGSGVALARTLRGVLAATALFLLGLLGYTGWQRYTHSRPLDLPGTGDIRLDGKTRQAFRLLHLNAVIHADLLFSRQGMFSHNLWSGIPTPTAQNATHWFWLLSPARQQEIINRLASTPRTALITCQSLDEFMVKGKIPFGGPLQDFVRNHYRPLFRYADFTLHVPVDSRAAIFGRYEFLEGNRAAGTVLFRTQVLLDGRPARIRLESVEYPWTPGPDLLSPGAHGVAEPIDREGRPVGPPLPLPSERPLRGLFRITVIGPRLPPTLPWQDYLAVVRDPDGRLLSDSAYWSLNDAARPGAN